MSESANRDRIFGEFIADVRGPKAVAHTGKFCSSLIPMPFLDLIHPFRHCFVCESRVLAFPGFVVEIRVGTVVSALAVLPNRILVRTQRISN
jgi:hypothetical protein